MKRSLNQLKEKTRVTEEQYECIISGTKHKMGKELPFEGQHIKRTEGSFDPLMKDVLEFDGTKGNHLPKSQKFPFLRSIDRRLETQKRRR